jgi:hypothetical protein
MLAAPFSLQQADGRMMRMTRKAVATVSAALFGAAACDGPASPPRDTHPAVVALTIDSAAGPIFRSVHATLDRPGVVEFVYGADDTPILSMLSTDTALQHHVLLPRLRSGREYRVQAIVPGSLRPPLQIRFHTGALPPALAAFDFATSGSPTAPVTLLELAGSTAFYGLLAVEDGHIVGYLPSAGSLFGSVRRANGDIVLLDGELGLVSYRLDGSIAHRLPQPAADGSGTAYGRIHHDVTRTPANTLLFIANETRVVAGEAVVGEALWEWNPEAGSVVKRWSAFDHLDWTTERGSRSSSGNWLHGNGVSYGPRGNVIMSLRNVDQVISIAPDFSVVEWKLGGVNGTLQLDGQRFFGQHYASEPTPDRLLVYDNSYEQPNASSRAVEYRIERSSGRAVQVWEYRPQPAIYAALVGSAVRLGNGNTVVNFGMSAGHNGSTGPITVVEVNAAGSERWRLNPLSGITRLYRATPVESLLGERPAQFRPD